MYTDLVGRKSRQKQSQHLRNRQ